MRATERRGAHRRIWTRFITCQVRQLAAQAVVEPIGHDRGAQAGEVEGERHEGQLPVPQPEGVKEEELEVDLLGFRGGRGRVSWVGLVDLLGFRGGRRRVSGVGVVVH